MGTVPNKSNKGNAPVTVSGPSQMVQDMAAQNFALKNGGQMPPSYAGTQQTAPQNAGVQNNPVVRHPDGTPVDPVQTMGVTPQNRVIGRFEAQIPVIRGGNGMTADGTGAFVPNSASFGQNQGNLPVDYPMGDDNKGGQPVVRHPDGRVAATPQPIQNGTPSVLGNPTDVRRNDYSSLSDALNTARSRQASFKADPSQRDGGFFGWLRGLMPKNRPGRREGETDDEYDARRTRNMQMVATLADAIRHMGNIVNTSKGAPLQIFNDPNSMIEQGAKERKAQRRKDAAAKAAAEKAQIELTLKQQAAEADRLYKQTILGYKDAANKRAAQAAADNRKYKDDYFAWQKDNEAKRQERQAAQDKQKQDNWEKQFNENKRHHTATERISASKGSGRSGKGGSGSGGKYWFEDKDGKMRYQPNKTMWEQEYYREYGKLPEGESSVSKSTKTVDYKTGQETTTTERMRGASVTSQAAAAQNAAKAARNVKGKSSGGKSSGSKPKSKNGYKNTKALGL